MGEQVTKCLLWTVFDINMQPGWRDSTSRLDSIIAHLMRDGSGKVGLNPKFQWFSLGLFPLFSNAHLRACLKIARGAAVGDFGFWGDGLFRVFPKGKSTAARRVPGSSSASWPNKKAGFFPGFVSKSRTMLKGSINQNPHRRKDRYNLRLARCRVFALVWKLQPDSSPARHLWFP